MKGAAGSTRTTADSPSDAALVLTGGSLLLGLGTVLVWAAYRRDEDDEDTEVTPTVG